MKIINESKNTTIGENIKLADTFISRFLGLMPQKSLSKGQGLIIDPCNSIHMFFMRFPLDIVFVDRNDTVVYTLENIKPWRISKIVRNSKYVIELPIGTINETTTRIGDKIKIE